MKRTVLGILGAVLVAVPYLALAQQDLASLIQAGNRRAALAKIAAGQEIDAPQPDGTRPIHWAVYKVDYELLDALIAKKADVNVRNEFGATPIAEAAKLADARLVKTLLDAGAEPEGANDDGQTALMLAIKTGELPVVELLLNAGAKVNVIEKFHRQTPLMWAAAATRNAGPMVKMLLAKGADVKLRAWFSDWPTQITSEPRAQYRPVGGHTALLFAARGGCNECVEALIGAGADANTPTPEGVTALMLALDNDWPDTAKLLLDRGANPHLWDEWGRTALYIAVDRKRAPGAAARAEVTFMDVIDALLEAGVDVNAQLSMRRPSRGGNSGRFGDPLLSTGATALLRAVQANDMEVVRALLAKGANPNINAMGSTPFLAAAGVGGGGRGGAGLAMVDLLVQNGADVNAQVSGTQSYTMRVSRTPASNEGFTALHAAAQGGNVEMVKYLLEHGADPEIADGNGRKPIQLAAGGANAPGPGAGKGGKGKGGPAGPTPADFSAIRALLEAKGTR